uniref:Uncharacterized protein n=1 Tax=Anopheles atroparvus TaxID=41427 RepID=A0AAG5DDL3_ANOAO
MLLVVQCTPDHGQQAEQIDEVIVPIAIIHRLQLAERVVDSQLYLLRQRHEMGLGECFLKLVAVSVCLDRVANHFAQLHQLRLLLDRSVKHDRAAFVERVQEAANLFTLLLHRKHGRVLGAEAEQQNAILQHGVRRVVEHVFDLQICHHRLLVKRLGEDRVQRHEASAGVEQIVVLARRVAKLHVQLIVLRVLLRDVDHAEDQIIVAHRLNVFLVEQRFLALYQIHKVGYLYFDRVAYVWLDHLEEGYLYDRRYLCRSLEKRFEIVHRHLLGVDGFYPVFRFDQFALGKYRVLLDLVHHQLSPVREKASS